MAARDGGRCGSGAQRRTKVPRGIRQGASRPAVTSPAVRCKVKKRNRPCLPGHGHASVEFGAENEGGQVRQYPQRRRRSLSLRRETGPALTAHCVIAAPGCAHTIRGSVRVWSRREGEGRKDDARCHIWCYETRTEGSDQIDRSQEQASPSENAEPDVLITAQTGAEKLLTLGNSRTRSLGPGGVCGRFRWRRTRRASAGPVLGNRSQSWAR